MATSGSDLRGVVHGRTIQLDEDTGLPEGQPVRVTVQPLADDELLSSPGEGLRRAFGAWADDAEDLDKYLEWNRRQRKIGRPELET
jgi:hypothetical protein